MKTVNIIENGFHVVDVENMRSVFLERPCVIIMIEKKIRISPCGGIRIFFQAVVRNRTRISYLHALVPGTQSTFYHLL